MGGPKRPRLKLLPWQRCLAVAVCGTCAAAIARGAVFSSTFLELPRRALWLLPLVPLAAPAPALAELEGARERVAAVAQKLEELAKTETFAKVAAGGGDSIRRELGTVGTTSPLFDAEKAFKAMAEEVEDPEVYFETLEKLKEAVTNADADAYSSIFSMNSAAATPPQVYKDRAFKEVQDARAMARELMAMLKMK